MPDLLFEQGEQNDGCDAPVFQHFIAGEWVSSVSGRLFESRNPADTRDLIGWFQAEDGEVIEALQQTYAGEIILVPEETLAPGKYQLLEG